MRILLTEGSGLTSRQTAGRVAALGHTVGVLSSDPLGLTRCTRAVRAWHRVPPFGPDPVTWLTAAVAVARREHYDVLLPTQEQVTVLSWAGAAGRLGGVTSVVPPFDSLTQVQDKVAAAKTLDRLGLSQPPSIVVHDAEELAACDQFPAFVKAPIGTATSGVRRVGDHTELVQLLDDPMTIDALGRDGDGLLVQLAAAGPLAMLQSVFDRGRLVAFHANLRVDEGARGGASHKRSIVAPAAESVLEALGRALDWHGALSADAIVTEDGPVLIDINPRLVEPGNAWRAGVDLVGALLDVALDRQPARQPVGRPHVRTHQLILAVLGAAQHGDGRRGVLGELVAAARHHGRYAGSTEELTPFGHDWRAGLPTLAAATATLARPASWEWFSSGSVANYAITQQGWNTLLDAQPA